MGEYEVLWSQESIYDAADIEDYIEADFGEERAKRFHSEIDSEVERLGSTHKLYTGIGIYYIATSMEGVQTDSDSVI